MSALAFTLLALCLVGPVPAALARASWPLRAPRAALVLWQAIALAAVLSAFSAGIAIASRLFLRNDGPGGALGLGEIPRMGWPVWSAYVVVFGLTCVVVVPAMVNIAVTTAVLPNDGLPLPFVSYGGTAMVTLGMGIGILMSISKSKRLVQS